MTPEQALIRDAYVLYFVVVPLVAAVVIGGSAVAEWWSDWRHRR